MSAVSVRNKMHIQNLNMCAEKEDGFIENIIFPKVLILIATDAVGGPGKGLMQFIKHAPENEFNYILCNFHIPGTRLGQFIEKSKIKNLCVKIIKQRSKIDLSMIVQVRKIIVENDINVIQTHGYKPNLIGFILGRLCKKPWIGFAHGFTGENKKVKFYEWIDRRTLKYADIVVAVSESMKRLLICSGVKESKIRLIYNAVDLEEVKPTVNPDEVKDRYGLNPSEKLVGVVGRLSPEKGQLDFLRAFSSVISNIPNVKALIIGDGPDKHTLEEYCIDNGIADRVIFTGYQEVVANFYQILDILVLPSLSEGLPNVILEAMSFGIPVLATSIGGVPEIIDGKNGMLVPSGNPDILAAKLSALLADDNSRKELGLKGRGSLYPRFSPTDRARKIIGLYGSLLT